MTDAERAQRKDLWPASKPEAEPQPDLDADALTAKLRADKRRTRETDLEEWEDTYQRLLPPVRYEDLSPAERTALWQQEVRKMHEASRKELERRRLEREAVRAEAERRLAEERAKAVMERAARNKTLLPSGRAIVWVWLALVIFLIPLWGR